MSKHMECIGQSYRLTTYVSEYEAKNYGKIL